jgi:uncharacterized protein
MAEHDRPTAGSVEERAHDTLSADERRIRGLIPYGTESRDMGGWREVIEPGALRNARLDDLVATVDHVGVPIGRYPGTLDLEDRSDGMHWAVEPPAARADVREAIERGDLRSSSWRMVVAKDRWEGDTRHVEQIAELRDVAVATHPAYRSASVELRSAPESNDGGERRQEGGGAMPTDQDGAAVEQRQENENESGSEDRTEDTEERSGGSLRVEERAEGAASRGLADEFRARGFPGEVASMSFDEFRAASLAAGSSLDDLAPRRQTGVGLGYDERTVYGAFPRVAVDAGTTSVDVVRQSGRTLASAEDVVRDLAAVTEKPETDSEVEIVAESLRQVATVSSGIPNVYLESQAVASIIENDLRLAVNEGLDKLVLDELAAADNVPPGTDPLLVSIRKGITAVQAEGYSPSLVILDPEDAEGLDVEVTEPGTQDFIFGPGRSAPGTLFGLQVRVSKSTPNPVVADAAAVGRLYASPVSLQRFEADSGTTNRSNLRLELSALFGGERLAAAVRIAPSD